MKLIVLSDTHGKIQPAVSVLKYYQEMIQGVIHLGDYTSDAAALKRLFPKLPFYMVRGNNDYDSTVPEQREVCLGGKKILLTHGHRQRVYYGLDTIAYYGLEKKADAVFFGHTHCPLVEVDGPITFMNPGSISYPRATEYGTFGIVDIQDGIRCQIMEYREKEDIRFFM